MALLAGLATGRTFTLNTLANSKVGAKTGTLVVRGGRAVYSLSGETSRHFKCTQANQCFSAWKPVTVAKGAKLTKAPGIKGKLGTVKRSINGRKQLQLLLGGHPLYTFIPDTHGVAAGDGLHSFGGTWKAELASKLSTMTTSTMTTTPTYTYTYSTTPTYTYPPYTYTKPRY
jgi:predicted lipoprotein with Yx(FWY)xxD motif